MAAQYVTDETVFPTDCPETEKIMNSQRTYIPATQRPDGTWRKARRVKDGYIPQEEMPLYESKGKQWAKNKPTLPVGLNPDDITKDCTVKGGALSKTIPGLVESDTSSKSSKKKKKKKNDMVKEHILSDSLEKTHISSMVNVSKTEPDKATETLGKKSQPVSTDPAKRIRNLKKKLRDIDALKQKIESGELAKPEKEQLEKISRRDEIEAEINELEFEMGNQ